MSLGSCSFLTAPEKEECLLMHVSSRSLGEFDTSDGVRRIDCSMNCEGGCRGPHPFIEAQLRRVQMLLRLAHVQLSFAAIH